jgi:hypothetical protein
MQEMILTTKFRHDTNIPLTTGEIQQIRHKWDEFTRVVNDNDFDLVVDGANVGHLTTHGNDIDVKFLQKTLIDVVSKTNKNVLLILHQRHTTKFRQVTLPTEISNHVNIYFTPCNVNDDWFWLYASLSKHCFILTNDQSRDHACRIAYQNEIKRWEQFYQIKVDPRTHQPSAQIYTSKKSVIARGVYYDSQCIHIVMDDMKTCVCVACR